MLALQSLAGVVALPLIAWLISEDRRAATPGVMLRRVAFAIAAQFLIAAVLLRIPAAALLFEALGSAVRALQAATLAGMSFVFAAPRPSPRQRRQTASRSPSAPCRSFWS
jgi:CNT family concentrative nucleoside transporter